MAGIDPVTLSLIGAGVGAATNENRLKGAITGGLFGAAGGALSGGAGAAAGAAKTAAVPTGLGTATNLAMSGGNIAGMGMNLNSMLATQASANAIPMQNPFQIARIASGLIDDGGQSQNQRVQGMPMRMGQVIDEEDQIGSLLQPKLISKRNYTIV